MVDAACGNNGSSFSISSFPAAQQPPLTPDTHNDKCRERTDGRESCNAYRVHNHEAISPRRWIVVVAVQKRSIDDRADLVLTGLDQTEPHVSRGKFDSVEILRDASVRRGDHDRADVRPLPCVFVPLVSITCSIGNPTYRFLIAG